MTDKPLSPAEQQAFRDLVKYVGAGPWPPDRSSPAYNFASALLGQAPIFRAPEPPVIKDRWFKDDTIKVDGYAFEHCRFDSCKLVTETATFTFKNCFVAPDCKLVFGGPALKVVRLLMHKLIVIGRLTPREGEQAVYATVDGDGNITIE
jgi:hypothetical protein